MKKVLLIALIVVGSLSVFGCAKEEAASQDYGGEVGDSGGKAIEPGAHTAQTVDSER